MLRNNLVFLYFCRLKNETLYPTIMSICKIFNTSDNPLPAYESAMAAGLDLRANLSEPLTLNPGERQLVPTGLDRKSVV